MKVLIVAATKAEITPALDHFGFHIHGEEGIFKSATEPGISVLITGVGMLNTAYYMGRYSPDSFEHVINAGICGAFDRNLKIGEVLNITSDTISEMGAENDTEFITYLDLNLGGTNSFQYQMHSHYECLNDIKKVKGITVNKVHGNEESIARSVKLFDPDVESMEGAAFLRGCKGLSRNYFQLRAVSNYVEKRDKSKWDIPAAVKNLNSLLIELIEEIKANSKS
jgi:futalosine hydrolase